MNNASDKNIDLEVWKALFPASERYLKVVLSCVRFWANSKEGLRELFFFMTDATNKTYGMENTFNNPYSPLSADLNSLRESLFELADKKGTFDPVINTAYSQVRYHKASNSFRLAIDLTYKGRLHLAKTNGLVKDVDVQIVCKNDKFKYLGKNKTPEHSFPPLSSLTNRGEVLGAYCVTSNPNDDIHTHYTTRNELDQIKGLAKDKDIYSKWPEKMLAKTVINQSEKDWYNQKISPVALPDKSAVRLPDTKALLSEFLEFCDVPGGDKTKLAKIIAYGLTFFSENDYAKNEGENILMLLSSSPDLVECKRYTIVNALLALDKYQISLSKSKQHCYLTARRYALKGGAVKIAFLDLTYQGMREIAFSGITNTSRSAVTKIEFELAYSKDQMKMDTNQIPTLHVRNPNDRGDLLGGFVIISRGEHQEVKYVTADILERIASCSKNFSLKKLWPKQYARKSLLRQTFTSWL